MSYSDAYTIVQTSLGLSGLDELADLAAYTDRTRQDKYQRQAILNLDLIQHEIAIKYNKHLLQRAFTITTSSTATQYALTGGQFIEGLKANSFFNVTASGASNGPIDVIPHERWRLAYPTPDLTGRGRPLWLIPLPDDGTDTAQVVLFPYADATYQIEGRCRVNATRIVSGSDKCILPERYEHLVIRLLRLELESSVGEGRAIAMQQRIDELWQEVLRDSSGALEEEDRLDTGIALYSKWTGESQRDYNPLTDVVPPLP